MKEKLRVALSGARARCVPAVAYVRANRFWVECASVTALGLLSAFAIGYASLGRKAVLEAQAAELRSDAGRLDRWRTELKTPPSSEVLAWRESERTLMSLGGEAARPLAVARLLAQRAAEVGISGLRVQLLGADSIVPSDAVAAGGWTVEPSGEGLSVEFEGDMGELVGLLAALPPQAAVEKVEMAPHGDALGARIVVLTRRIEAPR